MRSGHTLVSLLAPLSMLAHGLCGCAGYQPNAWMIDFAKTVELPQSEGSEAEKRLSRRSSRFADDPDNYKVPRHLSHRKMWLPANHEDGYLLGLDSLINVWGA